MMAVAGLGVAGLGLASAAALRAWTQWLELKHLELSGGGAPRAERRPDVGELRERVRRLEAIASGEA
jgi:hypothetical protein